MRSSISASRSARSTPCRMSTPVQTIANARSVLRATQVRVILAAQCRDELPRDRKPSQRDDAVRVHPNARAGSTIRCAA